MQPDGPERIDYQETPDVTEVHAAAKREHGEPRADTTPIPVWLAIVCGIAVFWAGLYVGVFNGGFSSSVYDEYMSSPVRIFSSEETEGAVEDAGEKSLAEQGAAVYANCQACHQASGMGLPGQFPPLAGSHFVVEGEKKLIAILLKGLQGPVEVNGAQFNGQMPPWEASLPDKKIAAVASYIRSQWGNTAPEITPEKVAAGRKEFASQAAAWTVSELQSIPADANFEGVAAAPAPAPAAGEAKPEAAPAAQPGEEKTAPEDAAPAPAPASAPAPAPAPADAPAPAPAAAPVAPAEPAAAADPAQLALGKTTYMTVCFACHMPTGLGLPPVFPPLAKSPYVNGSPERFAAIILKGNIGPFTIDGKPYNTVMPAQEAMLTDDKIAAVMTFVRASFENTSGPVSAEVVAAARKKYADRNTPWTQPELDAWK